jgi:hypothetical protein
MPWFYFHLCDERNAVPDQDGLEFADTSQALRHGEQVARDLLARELAGQGVPEKRRVEVRNEAGDVIGIFRLKDLLR